MEINNKKYIPALRFPEFQNDGEWELRSLADILNYEQPGAYIVNDTNYKKTGTPVLTANKGFILGYTDESYGVYNDLPVIIFDDFTTDKKFVNFPFKVKSSAIKLLTLKNKNRDDLKFIFECMKNIKFEEKEHKRYYISTYQNIKILVPKSTQEQKKIADCFVSIDKEIDATKRKLEQLKEHKKGLMQKLFPTKGKTLPELRFPEFQNDGEWIPRPLSDILNYEQPTPYIVENDTYRKEGTPVLTANKGFILGYTDESFGIYNKLPVIIFDDFTTDKKYVDFSFKIKSSAMKLLTLKDEERDNLRFIFECMSNIVFEEKEHKRYYISEYQHINIYVPSSLQEQNQIADTLLSIDKQISEYDKKIKALELHKKGLMQQLFPKL